MIDDAVLAGRMPRLGTITTGHGVEATSQRGSTYSRPTRASTLVFHCDDPEVANAVQVAHGGDIRTDSPTWGYDVVTDVRQVDVVALTQGFRQSLELWRAAECVRRCDGVTMSTLHGKPTDRPCLCESEMTQGQDRTCKPSTILPVTVVLDVERLGVWEVRSNAWGTASALKGSMKALTMVGASGPVSGVLNMVSRTVRDGDGQPHDVEELHLTIAEAVGTLTGGPRPTLAAPEPDRRAGLLARWSDLQARAHKAGIRELLLDAWRRRGWYGRHVGDLDDDELGSWCDAVEGAIVGAHIDDLDDDDHLIDWVQDATIAPGDIHPAGDPKPPETDVPDLPGRAASEDRPGA